MPDRTSSTSDTPPPLSRRSFLSRLAAVGAVGLGGSTLLAACGGDDAGANGAAATSDGARVVEASSCEGYDALDPQALQTRQALAYADASPREGQYCTNCRFYNQPQGGSPCGGCQLFAGPVSPGGWCQSWAAMAA